MQVTLKQAAPLISRYLECNRAPFIIGDPGIGKSDLIRQIAARSHKWANNNTAPLPVIDLRAALLDAVDLKGIPVPDMVERITVWLQADFLPSIKKHGEFGILFLDELPNAPTLVQSALLQLVLDRVLGDYVFPSGWRIVAAGNRSTNGAGAAKLITSLRNRFVWIDVMADAESFAEYCHAFNVPPVIAAFCRFKADLLHKMPKGEQNAFPSPRTWVMAADYVGDSDATRLHLISGCVGDEAAGEFEAFIRVWRSLPTPDAILANPGGTVVPSEPSAMYAVSAMLSRIATRATMTAVCTYAARLSSREFEVMAIIDAVRRDVSLTETPAFIQWASRNSDVTI